MKTAVSIALMMGLSLLPFNRAAADEGYSRWTPQAMIEAPWVMETAVDPNGHFALFVVRQDHLAENRRDRTLVEVDLKTGARRTVLTAPWVSRLSVIPGAGSWSFLADLGKGVQLYRMTTGGQPELVVAGAHTVVIGADSVEAVLMSAAESNQAFGVLDYEWSPDGAYVWYSTARTVERLPGSFEVISTPLEPLDEYVPNISELRVRGPDGTDRLMGSARGKVTPYPTIVYGANAARWETTLSPQNPVLIFTETEPAPNPECKTPVRRVSMVRGPLPASGGETDDGRGPNGGQLTMQGFGADRRLIERLKNGQTVDFGVVDFDLISSGTFGAVRSWDGKASIAEVRYRGGTVRNGLVRLHRSGAVEPVTVKNDASLSDCSIAPTANKAFCIQDALNQPPRLVTVDLVTLSIRDFGGIDERYHSLKPFRVEARTWKSGDMETSGFVMYPRGYVTGQRYPAILVTHGPDADNRFVNPDMQWSYPLQTWAERGYVVVYVNDINPYSSELRWKAGRQWSSKTGSLSPETVQDRVWLDQVKLFEAAVDSLDAEGLVDPAKVGIVGYSRGSQLVNVTVTQSSKFKAASSGDGGYFAPTSYWSEAIHPTLKMLFGGSPFDPKYHANWRRLAPVFRADKVQAAVLFQVARVHSSRIDFFNALRACGKPAEYGFFSRDSHLLHVPQNRLLAMQQNLDWFDFWFKGVEDSTSEKTAQYARWRVMRGEPDVDIPLGCIQ